MSKNQHAAPNLEKPNVAWDLSPLEAPLRRAYDEAGCSQNWAQERPAILASLVVIANKLTKRYSPKGILGVGGSGIVLRLHDRLFPEADNALKLPRPVEGKADLLASLLQQEIQFLARLRHPGIVRILYYHTEESVPGVGRLPFLLMEAIDGTSSASYARRSITDQKQLLRLVKSTAEILQHLHSLSDGFAHLDLKPENFVVTADGRPVMIDLGTCKRLTAEENTTTIACTRHYAHPELIRQLAADPTDENRARGRVARSDIKLRWDLWSFGLTILTWLGFDHQTGKVEYSRILDLLDPYTRKYLLLVAARLLSDNPYSWLLKRLGLSETFLTALPIESANELVDVLSRIDGADGPLARIPELQTFSNKTLQAAPGVHVQITPALSAVLQHRLFRRLSTISQLGLVSQVYPGARHSRREHSLGTYANTIRLIKSLYHDPVSPLFRQIVSDDDCRDVLLAALLHDIGHFPLAHDLEDVDDKVFNHSELTQAMIRGHWDKKKKGSEKVAFDAFDDIYRQWSTTGERLLAILGAKPKSVDSTVKLKLLRSLISGPIDADKLDYLFRDGRNLDLPYPLGTDLDRLYRCLTTVIVEAGSKDIPVIGVHSKGKVSAEFLCMARYAMFSQAYWHHAVRAQKAMLLRAVEALLARTGADAKIRELQSQFVEFACALPEVLFQNSAQSRGLFEEASAATETRLRDANVYGQGTDLAATDAAVLAWLLERLRQLNSPEASLLEAILSRDLFKRLWVISYDMEPQKWEKLVQAWQRMGRSGRHTVAHEFEKRIASRVASGGLKTTTTSSDQSAEDRVDRWTKGKVPWLLIDIPGDRPGSEVPLHYVLESQRRQPRKDDRVVGKLEKSAIWEDYAKNLLQAAGKIRIFSHSDLADNLEASISWEQGIEDLVSVFEEAIT